jgi:hypothetical protein
LALDSAADAHDAGADVEFGVSMLESIEDNHPQAVTTTWPRLVRGLTRHLHIIDKRQARLWSPARYAPGATRGKAGVLDVAVFAFDIDDGTRPETVAYWLHGLDAVIDSSFSHTDEHPKLRVIIRVSSRIPSDEYDSAWRRANQHLLRGHVDPSTKDVSRMYFLPSCPPGAQPVAMVLEGEPLDWRALPSLPAPRPLPKRKVLGRTNPSDNEKRADILYAKWARDLADMPKGGRHNKLRDFSRAAGGLIANGLLDELTVVSMFFAASVTNGLVAEDGEASVRDTIRDGIEYGRNEPWVPDDLPDSPEWLATHRFTRTSRGMVDSDTGELLEDNTASHIPSAWSTWPDPIADEAYYGLAGDFARVVAPHTESDPVAILVQTLVFYGNAIDRSAHFRVEATRHAGNEYVVLVGETSKSRKGTSKDHVQTAFRGTDPVFQGADEEWARNHVTGGLSSGEGLINEVRDPIVKTEVIREKGRPTGEYQDVTVDQGVSDKRLLLVEAEFARVLRVSNRESNTLSPILRDAWDGRDLRTIIRTSQLRATEPHISVIGHITQLEVRRELTSTDAANGLGNRFVWLAVRRANVLPFGGDLLGADVLKPLVQRLKEAIDFGKKTAVVGMDNTARGIWIDVYPELSEGKPGLLGAMIARGEAHVRRFAMLYALLDCKSIVNADHLKAALALWDYAEASTKWIFGDMLGDPVADTVLDALRGTGPMARTDINNLFSRNRDQGRIGQALNALSAARLVAMDKQSSGGRPVEVWRAL